MKKKLLKRQQRMLKEKLLKQRKQREKDPKFQEVHPKGYRWHNDWGAISSYEAEGKGFAVWEDLSLGEEEDLGEHLLSKNKRIREKARERIEKLDDKDNND